MYLNIEIADYLFQALSLENIYFLKAQKFVNEVFWKSTLLLKKFNGVIRSVSLNDIGRITA